MGYLNLFTKFALLTSFLFNVSSAYVLPRDEFFNGSMVLDEVPLVDGHNDLPYNLYNILGNVLDDFDFDSDLTQHPLWENRPSSHTDLPRLRAGKVGGQFWVAYVSCSSNHRDAVELTLDQIDVIKRLINRYPNDLKYVTTSDGILEAFNEGKIASMICVEGGHSIDSRLAVLRLYYELGVRYMTLTHNCNVPWADQNQVDSNTNLAKIGGLSPWGRNVINEMNRLGMMVDLSHVSKEVMRDAIVISKAPVIFSHSSSYYERAHSRNVDDEILQLLKINNGIIMVNFYSSYVTSSLPATIDDVIRHLNHIKNVTGVDHVGLGGDYDGVSSQPIGLEDVSKYPDLFDRLAESGHSYEPWTREELQKLAGLNLIRVMKEVENVRDALKCLEPISGTISNAELLGNNTENPMCRTNFNPNTKLYRLPEDL